VNVHRSLILITTLLVSSSLVGCASFGFGPKTKPVQVLSKPVDKTPLDLAMPDPLKTKPIEWVVITPDNAEEVFKSLEQKGNDSVLFSLTDDGYQQLALTIADLRNLINTQRNIILKYKEYYEPQVNEKK